MRQRTTLWLLGLIVGVFLLGGIFMIAGPGASASCRDMNSVAYIENIQNGKASKPIIHGKQCDTITFINRDKITREIAFGNHEAHVPYDGIGEKILNQNQRFTITLNQTGTFHWHDHEHDEVGGYFTVEQ